MVLRNYHVLDPSEQFDAETREEHYNEQFVTFCRQAAQEVRDSRLEQTEIVWPSGFIEDVGDEPLVFVFRGSSRLDYGQSHHAYYSKQFIVDDLTVLLVFTEM